VSYGCSGCYGATVIYSGQPQYQKVVPPAGSDAIKGEPEKKGPEAPKNSVSLPPGGDSQSNSAALTIKLPPDAKLYVDNVACPLTSDTRSFATPKLQTGQQYYYVLRADVVRNGETMTQSQKVLLTAGQQVTVEFPSASFTATSATAQR